MISPLLCRQKKMYFHSINNKLKLNTLYHLWNIYRHYKYHADIMTEIKEISMINLHARTASNASSSRTISIVSKNLSPLLLNYSIRFDVKLENNISQAFLW